MAEDAVHTWVCPSDRQLTLRSKLRAGWSVRASQSKRHKRVSAISGDELKHIRNVMLRAENMEKAEQKRVGKLVHRLEDMRNNSAGDGQSQCILCAEVFGKFIGATPYVCVDCKKNVCNKCCVEFSPLLHHSGDFKADGGRGRGRKPAPGPNKWLCKICSEGRELWKRSGAWFFSSLPRYILPEDQSNGGNQNHQIRTLGSRIIPQSTSPLCSKPSSDFPTIPSALYARHRSTICKRSSSSDSSDSDVSSFGKPDRYSKKSDTASITSSTSFTNSNDASSKKSDPFDVKSSTTNVDLSKSASMRSLHSPLQRKRKISGTRNRLNLKPQSEKVTEDNSVKSGRSSPELWSLHSSGVGSQGGNIHSDLIINNEYETDNAAGLGTLEFTLLYDSHKLALYVTVIRGQGLKAMDINGFSDPYVKLHLFPGSKKLGESTKMRTKTKQKTLNPIFDESLTYWGVTEADLQRKTLRLTVLDEDRFGQNEKIGEVRVLLKNFNLTQTMRFNMGLVMQKEMKEDEDDSERGRIMITLSYQPRDSLLLVTINRCSSLLPMARTSSIDPQVKVCLRADGNSTESSFSKTERRKNTKSCNPVYNEVLRLPIPLHAKEVVNCSLDVSVWDKDTFGKEHLIGAICFGIHSKGDKLKHWFNCVKKPLDAHEMWHALAVPGDDKMASLAESARRHRTPRLHRKGKNK